MPPSVRSLPALTIVRVDTPVRHTNYLAMLVRRQLLNLEAKNDAALDVTINISEMQRLITKDGLILLLEALTNAKEPN